MPVGTSDGDHYESEMHYQLGIPTVMQSDDLSQRDSGVTLSQEQQKREPLRLTVHPRDDMTPGPPTGASDEVSKELYFVRHGDTDLNEEGGEGSANQPVRGWSNVSLNDDGRADANKSAESVKDLDLTHIVSSDLPRAKETANIIGKKVGITPEFNPGLRTWDLGDLTEKSGKEVHDQLDHFCKEAQDERPPGSSESFNEFKHRILDTTHQILNEHSDEHKVLAVSHNSPERILNAWDMAGQPSSGAIDQEEYHKEGIEPGNHKVFKIYPGKGPTVQQDTPFSRWAKSQGERVREAVADILYHPENIVGTGELSPMLGHFAGKNALIADLRSLRKAMDLHFNDIVPPREIFKQTGWYKDPYDKHWKFFLGNKDVALKTEGLYPVPKKDFSAVGGNPEVWRFFSEENKPLLQVFGRNTKLKDIYHNPQLFEAYPDVADLPVKKDTRGALAALESEASTGKPIAIHLSPGTKEDLLSRLQHEIQHAIQGYEGFPRGASPGGKFSYKDYWRTSGEAEARNATYHLNFPEEVKGKVPFETLDKVMSGEGMTAKDIIVREGKAGIQASEHESNIQKMLDEGKSYGAIAKELGMTRGQVAGLINRRRGYTYQVKIARAAGSEIKKEPFKPLNTKATGDPDYERELEKYLSQQQSPDYK